MKKLNNISFIKTMTMLMIVLYHSMLFYTGDWLTAIKPVKVINIVSILTDFINTYTIPIFVFCSGYLFFYLKLKYNKYTNFFKDIKKRFNRLIIPYIFTSSLWIIPIDILLLDRKLNDIIYKYVLGFSPSQLWFLLMLFWVFLIYYLISNKLKFTIKEFIFVIFISFVLIYLSKYIPNYYNINNSLNYLLYYYFGGFIYSNVSNIKYSKIKNIILITLSLCSYIVMKIIPDISYYHYLKIIIKPLIVLFSIYAIYVNIKSFKLEKICNNKIYKLMESNSFGIYLFYQQIIYFVIYIFNGLINPIYIIILSFTISLLISNIMITILKKYKITKFMFGL